MIELLLLVTKTLRNWLLWPFTGRKSGTWRLRKLAWLLWTKGRANKPPTEIRSRSLTLHTWT